MSKKQNERVPTILGVIPARFASTRLMGKPLADIGGKPMIRHTYESTLNSKLIQKVIIAVDDEKVFQVVRDFGAEVMMTPKDIATGSDRIALVAKKYDNAEIIVNIQGDEPFISGVMIDQAIEPLLFDPTCNVSTLAKKIVTAEELESPNVVKVVFDYKNFAMYFSRSPIPYVREAKSKDEMFEKANIFKHIGLYVYRREYLLKYTQLEPTDLENIEKLEQLRMLENGFRIKIVETEFDSFSVDTPDDLNHARKIYELLKNPDN
ncbi:MAG TPA: 3-deoxy-manno-octulosonate cytidylyltransferase [Ignavibacteriaceae bacterium]|nr:3-deoxy-manno-octulosonate cytidylyltransferase [Ignavibacteriaceae bacterium]